MTADHGSVQGTEPEGLVGFCNCCGAQAVGTMQDLETSPSSTSVTTAWHNTVTVCHGAARYPPKHGEVLQHSPADIAR
jgi:hypothetical protein